jgi:hypothetical protein
MKKITKKKWLNFLRSRSEFQCIGSLYADSPVGIKHCVLGALNAVNGHPRSVNYPNCISDTMSDKLVELNDKEKYTFGQLATYISRNLKTED